MRMIVACGTGSVSDGNTTRTHTAYGLQSTAAALRSTAIRHCRQAGSLLAPAQSATSIHPDLPDEPRSPDRVSYDCLSIRKPLEMLQMARSNVVFRHEVARGRWGVCVSVCGCGGGAAEDEQPLF